MSISTYRLKHRNLVSAPKHRKDTLAFYRQAVERAIGAMRGRLNEPLELSTLAKIAITSPYHFLRVFEEITGISPGRFLAALRIEKAKELLLRTDLSVTDICFEVGYSSLGSFTSNFTELVGTSPTKLRRIAASENIALHARTHKANLPKTRNHNRGIRGRIMAPVKISGPVFVGLFKTRIPQGRPITGALLPQVGSYFLDLDAVGDGTYHVMAAALRHAKRPVDYLLPDTDTLFVGNASAPVFVRHARVDSNADILLRRLQYSDPPIVVALPLLVA
jgi:AraC family transcriptional regulator